MKLIFNADDLVVLKLGAEFVVAEPPGADFWAYSRSTAERTLVANRATADALPPGAVLRREEGWTSFRVEGILDFSMVGVLAAIAVPLAAAKISLFAVSTFNTDWVLIKRERESAARAALAHAGFEISDGV